MVDIPQLKRQILDLIKREGPLLPIHISRKLEKDTFFAGAVLSELVKAKEVKISSAKVGGSPLYYMSGQEPRLDQLIEFLPSREKEACELLRTRQALRDKECDPSIRVALRSVKDFAMPFDINGELCWRWYLTRQEEAISMLGRTPEKKAIEGIKKPEPMVKPRELQVIKSIQGDGFFDAVTAYFKNNSVEVTEHKAVRKNREIEGKIRVNSDLGKLDYFFVARNKKKLNDADLSLASELGRKYKLPVLFMSKGELSKKAQTYLESNLKGNLLFRKI